MNFQTILEELDRLYEELPAKEAEKKVEEAEVTEEETTEEAETEEVAEALNEAAEDEEILVDDEPIVDDEAAEEAPVEEIGEEEVEKQVVLECANCGGLVIKTESEMKFDEESDLMNVGEACRYCEAEEGYKVVGAIAPYNMEEEVVEIVDDEPVDEEIVEEGLFDKFKKDKKATANVKTGKKYVIYRLTDPLKAPLAFYDSEREAHEWIMAHKSSGVKYGVRAAEYTELEEGIFTSKAEKEKEYENLIFELFKDKVRNATANKSSVAVAFAVADACGSLLHAITYAIDDNKHHGDMRDKKLIDMVKKLQQAAPKLKAYELVSEVLKFASVVEYDDTDLQELRDLKNLLLKLRNGDKKQQKAYEFLSPKMVKQIISKFDIMKKVALGEELEADEEELEELLNIKNPTINLNLDGGTGNNVDVI